MKLKNTMVKAKRDNGEEYYHFTDSAPEELKNIFFENCTIHDVDYEMFSTAIDAIIEGYDDDVEYASVYTGELLALITVHNYDEIEDIFRDTENLLTACAMWYDNKVREMIELIKNN